MTSFMFASAMAQIDAANQADPHLIVINGQSRPLELLHAEQRTAWIHRLVEGEPSEALLIAARAQHVRRWEMPRESYPRTREAYLQWREDLKQFHAATTAEILQAVGYDEAFIKRVESLILKRRLKLDAEVQALEDALCLVFLETQFADFAKQEADKIVGIVQKTWRKMSAKGQQFALELPLSDDAKAVIGQALKT